jgi:hypothetical protein
MGVILRRVLLSQITPQWWSPCHPQATTIHYNKAAAAAAAQGWPWNDWATHTHSYSSTTADGKIGADAGEVAELLDATVAPSRKQQRSTSASADDAERAARARLLTSRREALSLYREVLRYSNLFVWRDEKGRVWRDVIRQSARAEFEAARYETDPELVARMLVTARDAVQRSVEGFMAKRARIIADEAARADSGGGGGGGGVGADVAPGGGSAPSFSDGVPLVRGGGGGGGGVGGGGGGSGSSSGSSSSGGGGKNLLG